MSNKTQATGYFRPSQLAEKEIEETFFEVLLEIGRAVEKHGYDRTPLSRDPADAAKKLAVLIEEVGEVAHALNYDTADVDNLKDELIQVATMALAWRASLS